MKIHPTAIIDSAAEIDSEAEIGPYTIISGEVRIGPGTIIGPHTTIEGAVSIGKNCRIFQFVTIGAPPQDLKYKGGKTAVEIGNENIIREYVTIHRGTEAGGGVTRIGDKNFFMAYTHIAHDCRIGNHIIFANGATLGGHVEIQDHVVISGLVAVQQFSRVGCYCFIGGKTGIIKDIPPYVIASGDRARLYGINKIGLKRHNFAPETIEALKAAYRMVIRSSSMTLMESVQAAEREAPQIPEVRYFLDFIKNSKRGVPRTWRKESD